MPVKPMLTHDSQSCPHCTASLVAQEIPKESRHNYLGLEWDEPTKRFIPREDDGRFLFYSHLIGISSMWHDRTLALQCPFCNTIDVIPGLEDLWAEYLRFIDHDNRGIPVNLEPEAPRACA